MAGRESQGLQVALILFVMVTVVLAVTTYLYFRKAEENYQKATEARARAKQAEDLYASANFQVQILKHVLGKTPLDKPKLDGAIQGLASTEKKEMEEIVAEFEQDMKVYGVGLPEANLTYRELPKHLLDTIAKRNEKVVDLAAQTEQLREAREQDKETAAARIAAAETARDAFERDLVAERAKFNADRSQVLASKTQMASLIPQKDVEIQRIAAESAQKVQALQKQVQQLTVLLDAARDQLNSQKEVTFEVADGEITSVNPAARTVWIDLGSADGLKRQMTFSVYDKNQTGVASAPIKGRIEVIRIVEPHLSECRILEDSLSDPILKDDKIYSPSFRKGQQTHFALVGFLDIDGDGRSDQEKIKSIITTNNGVIDAELRPDGTIVGKLTSTTRYLVKGDRPTDKDNPKVTDGYTELIGESTRLGIESITLESLLDRMGYAEDSRVVPMQRGGGALEREDEGGFRTRQPSAY